MQAIEFTIFQNLLHDVHQKAFGEPLSPIPHCKAQALSFFIEETTGQILSYKTLGNYICAALHQTPESVNPKAITLSILVRYLLGQPAGNDAVIWYQYRSSFKTLHHETPDHPAPAQPQQHRAISPKRQHHRAAPG
ncbi:MAG: hypothetical protein ABMA02_08740 [Saprospiraceae bacterium]